MERKFKAVAMRFTQEEFDKMDKSGMDINTIWDFNEYPYLINYHCGIKLCVTNFSINQAILTLYRTVIETCNPKLFREYCGLESVEEELKEAISKNKRGFQVLFYGSEDSNTRRLMHEKLMQLPSFGEFVEKPRGFIENKKTFQTKDIQIFIEGNNKWADVTIFTPDTKFRFKPNPTKTLDTEIEALNQKAKEMGFKAVVTFESL